MCSDFRRDFVEKGVIFFKDTCISFKISWWVNKPTLVTKYSGKEWNSC